MSRAVDSRFFVVVGAGMAGLLAANMLRNHYTIVIEAQPRLPNNHSAVLRFRSSVVGDALGIPFKKVRALKGISPWKHPVADAMAYSYKATGQATMRSIISANAEPVERYIAPKNLIAKMEASLTNPVVYSKPLTASLLDKFKGEGACVISTIPMPALMSILDPEMSRTRPAFPARPGQNIVTKLNDVDAYLSVYIPDPGYHFHRVSITGDELIIEYAKTMDFSDSGKIANQVRKALQFVGLPEHVADMRTIDVRSQTYAKILPIDDAARKKFITWATDTHGVYSLGRFACWRPGLLLDDVVEDVRKIERMIDHGNYDLKVK